MKKIYNSKIELVNAVKRSFVRLQDSIMGADMGWWFGERPVSQGEIRMINDLDTALELGPNFLTHVNDLLEDEEEELEKAKARINAWSARWSACHVVEERLVVMESTRGDEFDYILPRSTTEEEGKARARYLWDHLTEQEKRTATVCLARLAYDPVECELYVELPEGASGMDCLAAYTPIMTC